MRGRDRQLGEDLDRGRIYLPLEDLVSIGAFDGDDSERILRAGQAKGLAVHVHANQLGPGPGVRVAAEAGAAIVHLHARDGRRSRRL